MARIGKKFTLCRIFIQQRLSSKLGHVTIRSALWEKMQKLVRSYPLMWSEVGERALAGPALIKEAEERVAEIREKLKAAQSRQKSYTDKKRREISFNPGDFVYLKVSPIRGTRSFQVQGKLASSVHWTIPSPEEGRSRSIPSGATG